MLEESSILNMASECENTITIFANAATIEELRQVEFNPEVFLPTPYYEEGDRRWITWRYENWGTKRMYRFRVLREGVKGLVFKITSVRGPPIPFFKFLLNKFPEMKLKCEFLDENGYGGIWIGKNVEGQDEVGPKIYCQTWEDFDEDDYYEGFFAEDN